MTRPEPVVARVRIPARELAFTASDLGIRMGDYIDAEEIRRRVLTLTEGEPRGDIEIEVEESK